jgi:shikimate dehydrogenase
MNTVGAGTGSPPGRGAAPESRNVVRKDQPTFYFIGVTTRESSIMKVFPLWMRQLGRPDVVIEGVDLRVHDDREAYRQAVVQIRHDPNSLGALVTTHKIDLLEAAQDLFDYLDAFAHALGEVSCISKGSAGLEAHAKDPITAGLSLDAMLGGRYFAGTDAEVLCFGAGGSGAAIALHLMRRPAADRPRRCVVVNRSQPRLDRLRETVAREGSDIQFEYVCSEDPRSNDEILAGMSPRTLVINATGMGKDRPGSPITDGGQFPEGAIAWELNYRGDLLFMQQAMAQRAVRRVRVEDGWIYFLHGWTQVVAQVLHIDMTAELFARLAALAEPIRTPVISKAFGSHRVDTVEDPPVKSFAGIGLSGPPDETHGAG